MGSKAPTPPPTNQPKPSPPPPPPPKRYPERLTVYVLSWRDRPFGEGWHPSMPPPIRKKEEA